MTELGETPNLAMNFPARFSCHQSSEWRYVCQLLYSADKTRAAKMNLFAENVLVSHLTMLNSDWSKVPVALWAVEVALWASNPVMVRVTGCRLSSMFTAVA